MKADPTKNSLTGAKKKKKRNDSVIGSVGHAAANVGRAGLGTFNKAGSLAKSFNEAVLPIKEVKRIAKGKGSKGDYATTALSALPLIGKGAKTTVAAARYASKNTVLTQAQHAAQRANIASNKAANKAAMSKTAARVKETAKINKNLRNQNTIKRATERAETVKYRNANRPRPMSGPAAKRVEFESKALQKRQARIEKLDKTTVRRMNTPTIKGRIQSKVETRQNSKAVKAIRNRDKK